MDKTKPHFAKIGTDEIDDLLELIIRQQIDLTLWQKKSDFQEKARAEDYDLKSTSLILKGLGLEKLIYSEVLVNFRYSNRMYFSTADLTQDDNKVVLTFNSNIFKCEQRRNFRLSSSPDRRIQITIDGESLDAHDVSVTGIGIVVSIEQASEFRLHSGYDNALLQIGNHQFNIPFCKIVHIRDYFGDKKGKLIGVEFIEMPRTLEVQLYKTINELLYKELKG